MKKGVITKIISNQYTVTIDDDKYECLARGKHRYEKNSPVVGDIVEIDEESLTIERICPRKNKLERPVVANVDVALIMSSVKKPDLSLNLLDKQLTVILANKIEPVICFSKLDLLDKDELKQIKEYQKYYESIGIKTFFNSELEKIKEYLKKRIVVVTGQTGAGKSTFLNKIEPLLNLETKPISEALNRGVHTTRHVELYEIDDIYFVDTPGFSALDLNIDIETLKETFLEFGKCSCKYKDCNHEKEDGCEVKNNSKILPSRYENYLKFKKEIYENSSKLYK